MTFQELLTRLGRGEDANAAATFADRVRPMQSIIGGKLVPLFPDGFSEARIARMALTPTASFHNAPPVAERFPVLLYLGGAEEQSVLFEYLASYGYVVAAVPNIGTSPEFPGSSDPDRERRETVKAQDLAHVLTHVRGLANVDGSRIGAFGTGVGLTPAVRLQLEQPQVGLLVLTNATRYLLLFAGAGHPQLSSIGRVGDPDRAARDVHYDLMVTAIRRFLDAHFRADAAALAALTKHTGAPLSPTRSPTAGR